MAKHHQIVELYGNTLIGLVNPQAPDLIINLLMMKPTISSQNDMLQKMNLQLKVF